MVLFMREDLVEMCANAPDYLNDSSLLCLPPSLMAQGLLDAAPQNKLVVPRMAFREETCLFLGQSLLVRSIHLVYFLENSQEINSSPRDVVLSVA